MSIDPIASAASVKGAAISYARRGWRVIPLHYPTGPKRACSCGKPDCPANGKHPILNDWSAKASSDLPTVEAWWARNGSYNVGVAMGWGSGIIDIETDVKHDGDASLALLEMILSELPPTLSFRSGSGGVHRLFSTNSLPEGTKVITVGQLGRDLLERGAKGKTGIDVRGEGGQAVFPPSFHASGKRYEWINPGARLADIPADWIPLLTGVRNGNPRSGSASADPGEELLLRGSLRLDDIDEEAARAILAFIPADTTRLEWITVGEALKTQFGDAGLELFDEWSSGALSEVDTPSDYAGRGDVEYTWSTLGREGDRSKQVTFRSLIAIAKANGWSPSPVAATLPREERQRLGDEDAARLEALSESLKACADLSALNLWIGEMKAVELFDTSRDLLREAFRARWKEVAGDTIDKTDAAAMLDDTKEREEEARAGVRTKGWANPYAFCAEGESLFYNSVTRSKYKTRAFDLTYSSELISPIARAQGKVSPPFLPSTLLLNADIVPKVYGPRYAPGMKLIFSRDGERYVNTYVPGPAATPRANWTPEDVEAVGLWDAHLSWLLDAPAAKLLKQFLAFVARYPGKRVKWCPLIYGPEGIGKSIIGALMRAVLGATNAAVISPAVLSETKYNSWADGTLFSVIEEIKVDGSTKWEVMRALKEPITNDQLNIHPKGYTAYQTYNVTSYVAFTNHPTALALSANDRRFYIAATKHADRSFIGALGGEKAAEAYFMRLVGALEDRGGVFRGWLDAVDLEGFPAHRAPTSHAKEIMVEESRSELDCAIEEIAASGDYATVRPELIELEGLKMALMLREDTAGASGQAVSRVLRELGFEPLGSGERLEPPVPGRDKPIKSRWYVKRSAYTFDPHKAPTATIKATLELGDLA